LVFYASIGIVSGDIAVLAIYIALLYLTLRQLWPPQEEVR